MTDKTTTLLFCPQRKTKYFVFLCYIHYKDVGKKSSVFPFPILNKIISDLYPKF